MKLFLASEAKHPDSIEKLNSYIGGLKGKKIAYIPTAWNGELEHGEWKNGSTFKLVSSMDVDLSVVDLEDYKSKDVYDDLKTKDIIWFGGGLGGYLGYWILRTKLDIYIKKLLEDGKVFVGSSAGSMIASKTNVVSEIYIGAEERGANLIPGLGLIDFDIYPHYEDHLYDQIKSLYKGNKMYLLKNGEVIIVEDNNVKVLGEERIISN